jgi:uncharacterized membrane protein
MQGKEGARFISILTIIGVILIALGVAWEITQNWHSFSAAVKIIILAFFTLAAFGAGTFFELKSYDRIGRSLFVLGNLLYVLSVFQIAQIYHLGTGPQDYAWLFLACLAGVALASYYFNSYTSMFISFILFLIWMTTQFIAYNIHTNADTISVALYAFLVLFAGIFFYGLSLLHRSIGHPFASLYWRWSIFYFLLMAYIISFQLLLPILWRGSFAFDASAIFVMSLGAISIILIGLGIYLASARDKMKRTEAYGIILTVIVLAGMIFLTSASQIDTGACTAKQCYQFTNESSCNSQKELECRWTGYDLPARGPFSPNGFCEQKNCYELNTSESCNGELGCQWQSTNALERPEFQKMQKDGYCNNNCSTIKSETDCDKAFVAARGCAWMNSSCRENLGNDFEQTCRYSSEKTCAADDNCSWDKTLDTLDRRYMQGNHPISQAVWITINIFLIIFIIAIILFGSISADPLIVNMGIAFFTLDVITRYIGFIIDLKWYNNLALLFISGGIIIILGGILLERWRRKMVSAIMTKNSGKKFNIRKKNNKNRRLRKKK